MSSAVDRIDTRILQAQLMDDPDRWQTLEFLIGNWPRLWAFVLIGGLIGGVFYWWVGGWWCRVRLRWSGAKDPDKRLARLLYVYSSFVFAGPAVLALVGQTLLYPNYLVAYQLEFGFSTFVVVMIFWSLFTTYKGALALFKVSGRRTQVWFIALPAIFYFIILGGVGLLYAVAF
jgi:hypothetical protein